MWTPDDWADACDHVVRELLEVAQVFAPPVDALEVGRRLQMTLAWDAAQAGRGRLLRDGFQTLILLRPEDRPERVQWAAAHELGEAVAWRICRELPGAGDDLSPPQREQLANEFAQRLLLPTEWFQTAWREVAGELPRMKDHFPTASHELIAWRVLSLPTPRVISIWDQGSLTRRRSNLPGRLPPITSGEQTTWRAIHETGDAASQDTEQGRVYGWAIHEPTWKREIVIWEPGE